MAATSATASPAGALATTEADGTAASGSPGVGVAAALNFADGSTRAALGDGVAITAPGASFTATTTTDAAFGARSVSGAGSTSGVAVAGSLALHLGVLRTEAMVEAGATASSTGALSFTANSNTHHSARALPKTNGATGESTGVGASVAINIVDEVTRAQADTGVVLTGTALTQTADATLDVDTEAQGGASGGTAVAPVVAVTVVNSDARAGLAVGSSVTLSGGLTADARSALDVLAKGTGDAEGSSNAAVGASVVVTHAAPVVEALLDGSLQAAGAAVLSTRNTGQTRTAGQAGDGVATHMGDGHRRCEVQAAVARAGVVGGQLALALGGRAATAGRRRPAAGGLGGGMHTALGAGRGADSVAREAGAVAHVDPGVAAQFRHGHGAAHGGATARACRAVGDGDDVEGVGGPQHQRAAGAQPRVCLLYTSPSPRDRTRSRMPSSA